MFSETFLNDSTIYNFSQRYVHVCLVGRLYILSLWLFMYGYFMNIFLSFSYKKFSEVGQHSFLCFAFSVLVDWFCNSFLFPFWKHHTNSRQILQKAWGGRGKEFPSGSANVATVIAPQEIGVIQAYSEWNFSSRWSSSHTAMLRFV